MLKSIRRRAVGAAALLAAIGGGGAIGLAAGAPAASGAEVYYCGFVIPQGDCYNYGGGRAVFNFGVNNAYVPGSNFGNVCERVYIYGGGTISRRCGGHYESTGACPGSDIDRYYRAGYTLDGRAGNNQSLSEKVGGHAYQPTCV